MLRWRVQGVYNYDRQLKDDYRGESNLKDWLAPMLGDIAEDPDVYRNLSPLFFADKIKAEVLLIHGGADTTVSASQSKQMSKALKKAGKQHEIEINTWGVHGLYKQKESFKYGNFLGEFLKKHL
jgi:dipeptidyl aminopeptidase/acylaminoacyl peptidase